MCSVICFIDFCFCSMRRLQCHSVAVEALLLKHLHLVFMVWEDCVC